MVPLSNHREAGLSDQVYIELVRSLYAMPLPSVVMSILFVGTACLAARATSDGTLFALGWVGTILSGLRLAIVIGGRRNFDERVCDRFKALEHERRFAICYVGFAAALGIFSARVMVLPAVQLQMVVGSLVVGYAAGVAAGISLRPRIGITSTLLAVVPSAVTCLATGETYHIALGVVLLALLIGGLQSMDARHAAEISKINIRQTMSGLARLDHLTGLPNRLGLDERFQEATASREPGCLIAVHCLDLDRFKPVNDHYGHPVGDALLRIMSSRLAESLDKGDTAARIGGDEFVILQCGVRHPNDADLFARRLSRALCEPYYVEGRVIQVGASIGYVVSDCESSFGELLVLADKALYAIKAAGGGAAAHSDLKAGKATIAA